MKDPKPCNPQGLMTKTMLRPRVSAEPQKTEKNPPRTCGGSLGCSSALPKPHHLSRLRFLPTGPPAFHTAPFPVQNAAFTASPGLLYRAAQKGRSAGAASSLRLKKTIRVMMHSHFKPFSKLHEMAWKPAPSANVLCAFIIS